MSPEELKKLRNKAGVSVDVAARQVEITTRSWQRYESGERKIPKGVVKLFCLTNSIDYPP